MKTIPLALWLSHSRSNETPVIWQGKDILTLGQLRTDVLTLTEQLLAHSGSRWALCIEDSYWFVVALLATLHAGKTPIIPGHHRIEQFKEQQIELSGVISDQPLAWSDSLLLVPAKANSKGILAELPPVNATSVIEFFTSGSTGQPKRVIKPVYTLDEEARLLATHFGHRLTGCRVVASVVPYHLYGMTFRIMLPMALGLPLQTDMLLYAEQLTALDPQRSYLFISSPAFLKRLDPQLPAPSISMIMSAGGVLPWENVRVIQNWLGILPDEIYGSTETGVLAWRSRTEEQIGWQPFPCVQLIAEHDHWRAISPLIPQSEGLLLDDKLVFDNDGLFKLIGRKDRIVKIEEKRVSLTEIEDRLLNIDGILEAVALVITRNGRSSIGALLVLNDDFQAQWQTSHRKHLEQSWRKALMSAVEPIAIPRYWRVTDTIPTNSMNKRIYTQLQELFNETP